MNINRELLQFYVYKKVIKKKQSEKILEDCERLKVTVRDYMLAKEYSTDVRELPVLGDFYCMPYVEIDMLEGAAIRKTLRVYEEKQGHPRLDEYRRNASCCDRKAA